MDRSARSGAEAELEALFRWPRVAAPGSLIGIEHEYVVRRAGMPVDFRGLLHQLAVPGMRLDPGDANAYRLTSGLALTCDEDEAEIATPPIAVRPGFVGASVEWAGHGRAQLESLLPVEHEAEGYSTHVSAAMPSPWGDEVANLYARTFAPALALLLERPESQGIYVRPRPGRLELCGEFVEGSRLGAVAAFVAGSSRAAALAVAGSGTAPPALAVQTLPAVERYGLRVTRYACGFDLYGEGRRALLQLAGGGEVSAQEYIEGAWRSARGALGRRASADDVAVLDRIIAGALPLGVETREPEARPTLHGPGPSSPLGQVTRRWRRRGFAIWAVVATWDFTVFRVEGPRANALVSIPRESLPQFIAKLEAGMLDRPLLAALESASLRPMLTEQAQTRRVGVFPGMGDPAGLLSEEREPESGMSKPARERRTGKTGADPFAGRIGKSSSRRRKLVIPAFPRPVVPLPIRDRGSSGPAPGPVPPPPPPPPAEAIPPPQLPTYPEPPPSPLPVAPLPVAPPPSASGPGAPWLVVAAVAAIGLLGAIVVGVAAANTSGSDSTPTPAPLETATKTAEPIPSPTRTATVALATATSTPKVDAAGALPTSTNSPAPTSTVTPVPSTATSQPTPTVAPNPTETPVPTATATRFATETPRPTATPTITPTPTSTSTPTRTAIPTPTRILDIPPPPPPPPPPPTVVPSACTPVPGAVWCP